MKLLLPFIISLLIIPFIDFIIYLIIKKPMNIKKNLFKKWFYISIANSLMFPLMFLMFRLGWINQDSLIFKVLIDVLFISVFIRVILLVFSLITSPLFLFSKFRKIFPYLFGGIIGISFIYFVYCSVYTRTDIKVKRIDISSDKIPANFNGFKLVQISDFHVGSFNHNPSYITKVVNEINSLEPDLILFTGDMVNSRAVEMDPYIDVLKQLNAKYGIFSVLGNHDYGYYYPWSSINERRKNFEDFKANTKNINWTLLNNESIRIGIDNDSITLLGVENWGRGTFSGGGDLNEALENVNDEDFKILMSHNPDHWIDEVLPETNIDLTLSGHTHSMQIEISFFGMRLSPSFFVYEKWGGLYEDNNQKLYVNRGLGYTLIPIRINANPEITLFELKTQN